ncbi:MAG: hypothetical protein WC683_05460 [bacterium]
MKTMIDCGWLQKKPKKEIELSNHDLDELVYRSYKRHRDEFPEISPDMESARFGRTKEFEERYQREKALEVGSKVTRMYQGHSLDRQFTN